MNYWNEYGIWTVLFLALFPRLTLLFGAFASGGLLWWLGWIFAPHILVAVLAIPFFDSNPVLVIIAWIIALIGTHSESRITKKK